MALQHQLRPQRGLCTASSRQRRHLRHTMTRRSRDWTHPSRHLPLRRCRRQRKSTSVRRRVCLEELAATNGRCPREQPLRSSRSRLAHDRRRRGGARALTRSRLIRGWERIMGEGRWVVRRNTSQIATTGDTASHQLLNVRLRRRSIKPQRPSANLRLPIVLPQRHNRDRGANVGIRRARTRGTTRRTRRTLSCAPCHPSPNSDSRPVRQAPAEWNCS